MPSKKVGELLRRPRKTVLQRSASAGRKVFPAHRTSISTKRATTKIVDLFNFISFRRVVLIALFVGSSVKFSYNLL